MIRLFDDKLNEDEDEGDEDRTDKGEFDDKSEPAPSNLSACLK
jgi:hypothetical protein